MLASLLLAPIALLLGTLPDNAYNDSEPQIGDKMVAADKQTDAEPETGTLILRPALNPKPKEPTRVINIELVFTAVEKTKSGRLVPRTDVDQQTYTVGIGRSYHGQDKHQSFDGYHTRSIVLPGGTYTLGEIHYYIEDRGLSSGIRPDLDVTYCLSDRSFVFNVGGGEVVSLGGISIEDIPSNPGQFDDHLPIAGIDMTSALVGASDRVGDFTFAKLADTAFGRDSGICKDAQFNVAGW